MPHISVLAVTLFSLSMLSAIPIQETPPVAQPKASNMNDKEIFPRLTGRWKGTCQTWFEPNKLADDSLVEGEFSPVLGGRFIRHTYTGSMMGKPRQGEDLLAFNSVTEQWESSWVDDFHMSDAILYSVGKPTESGFAVKGNYDWKKGEPQGGWRTEFVLDGSDTLTITAFNIMPDGSESKAVETKYQRVK